MNQASGSLIWSTAESGTFATDQSFLLAWTQVLPSAKTPLCFLPQSSALETETQQHSTKELECCTPSGMRQLGLLPLGSRYYCCWVSYTRMFVCTYVFLCTYSIHIYMSMRTCMLRCAYVCVSMCTCVSSHMCMFMCVGVYRCICVYMHACVCMNVDIWCEVCGSLKAMVGEPEKYCLMRSSHSCGRSSSVSSVSSETTLQILLPSSLSGWTQPFQTVLLMEASWDCGCCMHHCHHPYKHNLYSPI